jgi:two-component system chemotaxis response regulator CheB
MIVVGGSAGSLIVLLQIIKSLTEDFIVPLLIVVHRQRNNLSEFTRILAESNKNKRIVEPDDKEPIQKSTIYISPQNYHLLIEKDYTISLDYSEPIKFSRPSIDVTFESAATVYNERLVGVLLSGANSDGTAGLAAIVACGGTAIVQDPETAEFTAMPLSAIENISGVNVLSPTQIVTMINSLNSKLK